MRRGAYIKRPDAERIERDALAQERQGAAPRLSDFARYRLHAAAPAPIRELYAEIVGGLVKAAGAEAVPEMVRSRR